MEPQWKIDGTYFETCNCDAACPCIFLAPPTNGDCTVLVAWHIERGSFGSTNLDGLNIVMAAHSLGHMMQVKWKAALYVDERASQEQHDALTRIFGGQAGGHPANLAACIGQILGVKAAPIAYRAEGKRRAISISSIAEADIEAMQGQNHADVTVSNHPLAVSPGFPVVVAKSKKLSYQDYGYKWEISEKNGLFSPFAYHS